MTSKTPYGGPLPANPVAKALREQGKVQSQYAENQERLVKRVSKHAEAIRILQGGSTEEQYKLARTYLYNIRLVVIILTFLALTLSLCAVIIAWKVHWIVGMPFAAIAIYCLIKAIRLASLKEMLSDDYELIE